MHPWVVNLSPHFFFQLSMYSYGYTPFRIIRQKFSLHLQNLLVRLKFFFNALLSRSVVFFVLHFSHPNNAVYSSNFYQFHAVSTLVTLNSLVPHKLVANLSSLDAINLQLSINLNWIFLHTFVPSLLLTPANLTLILTLKLIISPCSLQWPQYRFC